MFTLVFKQKQEQNGDGHKIVMKCSANVNGKASNFKVKNLGAPGFFLNCKLKKLIQFSDVLLG